MTVEVVEVGATTGTTLTGVGVALTALDDLTDVSGATAGLTGQTLVKQASGQWQPATPAAATGYTHTQVTAAASWSGTHGLGRYPQAILLDPTGKRFLADLEFPTVNTFSVTHAEPLAGALHLQ